MLLVVVGMSLVVSRNDINHPSSAVGDIFDDQPAVEPSRVDTPLKDSTLTTPPTMTPTSSLCRRLQLQHNISSSTTTATWLPLTDQLAGDGATLSGWDVDISDDGRIVAVAATLASSTSSDTTTPPKERVGHVTLYEFNDQTGQFTRLGIVEGEGERDQFGTSLALSRQGRRLAAGGRWNDGYNGENSGHVRVFDLDIDLEGDEVLSTKQVGTDIDGARAEDQSGRSVSLSGDGARLAIGAPGHDGNLAHNRTNVGHVRVFALNGATQRWEPLGQDILGDGDAEFMGRSTSLSDDGTLLAVGSHMDDGVGSAKVFFYNDQDQVWEQVGSTLMGSTTGDWTGFSVSLSPSGHRVAVGSPGDNSRFGAGFTRVYENKDNDWELLGSMDTPLNGGYSVALTQDGSRVVVGDYRGSKNGINSGYAHVYDWHADTETWCLVGSRLDGNIGDLFGSSVAASRDGKRIVISAPAFENQKGATRVYQQC